MCMKTRNDLVAIGNVLEVLTEMHPDAVLLTGYMDMYCC